MQGKDTTISTFTQLFKAVTSFSQSFNQTGVDKYVKKFTALKFVLLMSFAQLKQLKSLRDISSNLGDEQLARALKLESISASQISRKQRADLNSPIETLFYHLTYRAGIKQGFNQLRQKLGRLYLIDSTVISLCLTRYRWADFRKTKSGVKMHTRIKLFKDALLPDAAVITVAKKADRSQMDHLVVEDNDAFNVFDRAYLDYHKFDSYCENKIRFASRLKSNALIEIVSEYPVDPKSPVIKDQKVILGKAGLTQMKHPLRIIETTDTAGKTVIIVTNDFCLRAEEIADIYRYRWQIELFFKWIKSHLHVKRFYGTGEQAVAIQLYIALITYCLLTLLKQAADYGGTLLNFKRALLTSLYEPFETFVRKLRPKSKRFSRGRRKIDYDLIYQETVQQVILGEADHLDDLTYDPVIL
jgi:hypothetical protein